MRFLISLRLCASLVFLLFLVAAISFLATSSGIVSAEARTDLSGRISTQGGEPVYSGQLVRLFSQGTISDRPLLGTESWYQYAHLTALDAAGYDLFGYSVAIDGDTAVIGALIGDSPSSADSGAAYVFVRSGNTWIFQQKLTPSDGARDDRFGCAVDVDGDTIIVGAYYDDNPAGFDSGSAYVFTRNGTIWTQQQKLTPSDGTTNDFFGFSVSISGDSAAVGARFGDSSVGVDSGSAYAFVRNAGSWTQQQKLEPSFGAPSGFFGTSLALEGSTLIIGSPIGASGGSSAVFVLDGQVWTEQAQLIPPSQDENFGSSVSLNEDTAVVGAPAANSNAGVTHVFVRIGSSWSLQQSIVPLGGAAYDNFGASVSVSGDSLFVGAPQQALPGVNRPSAAYAFRRNGATWTQEQMLTAPGQTVAPRFGESVALSDDAAFVGAFYDDTVIGSKTGSVFALIRTDVPPPPTPTPTVTPTPSPTPDFVRTVMAVGGLTERGGTVSIPIEMNADGNEIAVLFSLHFNPAVLNSPQIVLGNGTPPGTTLVVNLNQAASGRIGILLDSNAGFTPSPPVRTLVVVTFSVLPTAPLGSTTVNFASVPAPASISDRFGNLLPTEFVNGSVTVRPGIEADIAGGDGVVLANDVALLRLFAVGLLTPTSPDQCKQVDVAPVATYGDGHISSTDVVTARLYAVGLLQLNLVDGPCNIATIPGIDRFDVRSMPAAARLEDELDEYILGVDRREIKAGDVKGRAGDRVTIPIEVVLQGGEAAMGFTLEYDAGVLSDPRVALAESAPYSAVLTTNSTHPGKIGILVDSVNGFGIASESSAGSVRVVYVTFHIARNAVGGELPIVLTNALARKSVSDANGNLLPTSFVRGRIQIEATKLKQVGNVK
ncbi:MAG: cohesin domain-containing protein [Pyrinomonadaceae bacterium]